MKHLIWRARYTYRAWREGYDLRSAWYCSGNDDYWHEWSPKEAADEELSYARYDVG